MATTANDHGGDAPKAPVSAESVAQALSRAGSKGVIARRLFKAGNVGLFLTFAGLAFGGVFVDDFPMVASTLFGLAAMSLAVALPAALSAARRQARVDAECASAIGVPVESFQLARERYEAEIDAYAASKAAATRERDELAAETQAHHEGRTSAPARVARRL